MVQPSQNGAEHLIQAQLHHIGATKACELQNASMLMCSFRCETTEKQYVA